MKRAENYKIKTIVVEDEKRILSHICNKIITLDDAFDIVETAHNGQDAIEKIEALRPHVVFTDICMPVMDGMELIQRIKRINPNTAVVIISGYSDFKYAQQAIKYGVFNYLLKPLEDTTLLETLYDLKKNFLYTSQKKQRHMMYSENYELLSDEPVEFLIAEVCVGNLVYSIRDEEVNQIYADKMKMISWEEIMKKLYGNQEWFVADDHAVNQKIVGIKVSEGFNYSAPVFAEDLQVVIREATNGAVSVCTVNEYVSREELWDYAKRLRNIIKKELLVGKSSIFYLDEQEYREDNLSELIKVKLSTYIKNYFISGDFKQLIDEIRIVFSYMKKHHAPQEEIEKMCVYLLKLLEISEQKGKRAQVEELQTQMMMAISLADSEEKLYDDLIYIFRKINGSEDEIDEEDEVEKLMEFVDEHYLGINNMEVVAEAFGYNTAYLSRMFKKQAGESMSRYITNKKIGLAKDMLANRHDLKVTEISDLCGYNDYRYFCRVFKTEVGISPGEYKEKMEKIDKR